MTTKDTNTNLYTHARLDDFVKNFQAWFKDSPINPDNPGTGGNYKYFSFVPSPNAIHLVNIGRIPFDTNYPNNFVQMNTTTQNGNTANVNTPLGWKMQLGNIYADMKANDIKTINTKQIQPGLSYQIIKLPVNTVSQGNSPGVDISTFSDLGIGSTLGSKSTFLEYMNLPTVNWVDLFLQNYESMGSRQIATIINEGVSENIDLSMIGKSAPLNQMSVYQNSFVGIEWFGYFKPPHIGSYTFTINYGDSDYCLFWLGNKAICEYVVGNADITSNNTEFKQNILEDNYIPIRIQYYTSKQAANIRKISITIKDNDKAQVLSSPSCLFTIDGGNFFPSFVYAAFTSSVIDDFKNGKFKCYAFGTGQGSAQDYLAFYSYLKQNKKDIFGGKYDNDTRLGGSIPEFGTLMNGINYTDGRDPSNPNPNMLSIYRVYTDVRMGRNFQVDVGNKVDGQYTMRELSPNLVTINNEYTAFPDYYPTAELPITQKNETDCMTDCNNSPDCNYFYAYTSPDGKPYCSVGNKVTQPVFNQIATDSQKNGSLFLRENKLAKPTVSQCISDEVPGDYSKILNTTEYDNTNPYYNYTISENPLSTIKEIGYCGDPNIQQAIADYQRSKKEASDILYNMRDYDQTGNWRPISSGSFIKPNFAKDLHNYYSNAAGGSLLKESFQTTDAVYDTQSNINNLKMSQNQISANNTAINQNYADLSNKIIPDYLKQRDLLNSDKKYDFSGNVLLYLKDKKIPSKDEQRIIDSADGQFSQNSIYLLGTITVTTLIILAIFLGRD